MAKLRKTTMLIEIAAQTTKYDSVNCYACKERINAEVRHGRIDVGGVYYCYCMHCLATVTYETAVLHIKQRTTIPRVSNPDSATVIKGVFLGDNGVFSLSSGATVRLGDYLVRGATYTVAIVASSAVEPLVFEEPPLDDSAYEAVL